MGIKNLFKRQLSTVIEWTQYHPSQLFCKADTPGSEIKNASKLLVGPGQGVILVYEGKVQDVLDKPGLYLLDSDNIPFVTSLLKLRQYAESEHKMYLYYFSTADVLNVPWGTPSKVKFIDPVYNMPVELGANGNFSLRMKDFESVFINVCRMADRFTVDDMRELIASRIVTGLTAYLSGAGFSYRDIDSKLLAISSETKELLNQEFAALGLELTDFRINSTIFDKSTRQRIGRIADMTTEALSASEVGLSYVELEKLRALRDAARNEGGVAGAGVGIGVGMELGKTFSQQKDEVTQTGQGTDPTEMLKRLKLLLDEGILSQEEFDQKKKEILSRL